jgi:V/A-type H+-transporting ATPase subunit K
MELDLTSISAAVAIGAAALATGYAQAKIGSAAVGAVTEKRELSGLMIIFIAIPETIIILGFVIAYLLISG